MSVLPYPMAVSNESAHEKLLTLNNGVSITCVRALRRRASRPMLCFTFVVIATVPSAATEQRGRTRNTMVDQ